jgi:hypothetical protein
VVDHLTQIFRGCTPFPDPAERNDRWLTGVKLFTAATLARLKPYHPFLDETCELWLEIAARTFESGEYNPDAEIQAHRALTGATIKDSYLVLKNKYALTLLSSRLDELGKGLVSQILRWVWHHPEGINYLGVPAAKLPLDLNPGTLDRWFSTQELLSRFPGWIELAGEVIDWLWTQRGEDGLWDFGPRGSNSYYFPLSPSWRKSINRKIDWSARVLVLLSKYGL